MNESKARVWKRIGVFYTLTLLFSGAFDAFVLHAGKMDAGNFLYVTGAMWSPALAAFATKALFRESIRDLGWGLGRTKYAWLGYLIPIAYALPVYLVVWFTGLGGFAGTDFVAQTAEKFGWAHFSPALTLALFILLTGTLGLVGKTSRALGEEIGWRGFLVPELSKVVGFTGVGIISGLMWAVYHFPVLLFADYNAGTPAWYGLTCFTLMVVADSFILALVDAALGEPLAGGDSAWEPQSVYSIDPDTAHPKHGLDQLHHRRVRHRTRDHDRNRRDRGVEKAPRIAERGARQLICRRCNFN